MQEKDYLIYQELPNSINLKGKNLPCQNYRMPKKNIRDDFTTTKIIFTLIAVILSSIIFFMIVYLIPYFYHGWRFISNYFMKYKSWSFFPGL